MYVAHYHKLLYFQVAQLLTHYSTSVTVAQILQKIYSKEIKEDETKSIWNRGDSLLQQYFPSHYNDEIHLPPPPVQPPVHLSHYETIPSQTSHDTTPSSHMRPQSPPSYQDHHRDTGTASFQKEPSPVSLPPPSPSPRAPSPISLASQSTETNPHSFDTSYNNFPEEAKETSEQSTRTSHSPLTISIIEEPSDPHWEALLWHSVQNPWVPPSPPPSTYDLPPSQQSQPLPNLKPTFGWFSDDSGANLEWNSFQFNQPSVEEERTSEKVSFRSEFNETSAKHVEQLILADVTKPPSECEVESLTSSHVTIQSHEQQPSLPAIQIGDSAPEEVEFAASSISGRDKDTETEAEQNLIERVEESEDSEADEAVPEQSSLQRMRQWEEGNIDYLGKDRFDNILMKLQLMLYSPQPSLEGEEPFEESLTENPTHEETEVGSSASSFIEDEKGDEPSTPEKSELEESEDLWLGYPEGDFTGMMNWQEGKIDYCGRDRSDNIIRRLDEIISGSKLASTS